MNVRTLGRAAVVVGRQAGRAAADRVRSEADWVGSRRARADLAVFHQFLPPPTGGGTQFLRALTKELESRGLSVEIDRISGATPGPESSTVNRTHPSRALVVSWIIPGPAARTACSAFVTRLMTTCCSSWPSPRMGGAAMSSSVRSSTLSARNPHVPSIAEQRSTARTLAPVSSMSSRLLGPMSWAR